MDVVTCISYWSCMATQPSSIDMPGLEIMSDQVDCLPRSVTSTCGVVVDPVLSLSFWLSLCTGAVHLPVNDLFRRCNIVHLQGVPKPSQSACHRNSNFCNVVFSLTSLFWLLKLVRRVM